MRERGFRGWGPVPLRQSKRVDIGPVGLCALGVCGAIASLAIGCDRIVLDFDSSHGAVDPGPEVAGAPPVAPDAPSAPELVVSSDFNLSLDNVDARECADGGEAVAYRVSEIGDERLTLTRTPSAGCLSPGDELLLIQIQGAGSGTQQVGHHELLRVQVQQGSEVTLVVPPTQTYGNESAGRVGEDAVVLLQRVPHFARLTIFEDATLSAQAWAEGGSGVLALRTLGDAIIDGRISMNGGGFRGGSERSEPLATGQQGESIGGLGAFSTEPSRGGGGGGLGDQTTFGCVQDGNAGGGGGHLAPGASATVTDLCSSEGRGRGGRAYAQAGLLFLGSGGGSGGVDNIVADNPPGAPGGNGGGIVWLLSQSIRGKGTIESRGSDGIGDPPDVECASGASRRGCYDHSGPGGGGSGGTVRLTAPQVLGVEVDVSGGKGGNGYDPGPGNGGDGSPGVIERPAP